MRPQNTAKVQSALTSARRAIVSVAAVVLLFVMVVPELAAFTMIAATGLAARAVGSLAGKAQAASMSS